MPKKECILNLPGYSIQKVSGKNPVLIEVSYRRVVRCIHCGNISYVKKYSFIRRIRHESIGLRRSYLIIKAYKYYCPACNPYFRLYPN
jgi:transposase